MQQHEFNLFAKKIKQEGKLTTKQALDKFVKAMMQGPKLKIVKKQTIRSYENGIKIFADQHERCMTRVAWEQRSDEVYQRDHGVCQACGWDTLPHQGAADHIRKRSVGRDDRLSNLRWLCNERINNCHSKRHDEFKKAITPKPSSLGTGPNALSSEGEISQPNKSEFKKRGAGQ